MARIRKKLSKSAIILLAVIAIAGIALLVCHFAGIFDLSFVGEYAMIAGMAMSESAWTAGGAIIGILAGGVFLGFWLKDYIIGVDTVNTTITGNTSSYVAQERVSTPASSDSVVTA